MASIGRGFLVFVGVTHADTDAIARRLGERIARLRLFEDEAGKMNLSLSDVGGRVLCVSQFTLYGDVRRGLRPSFDAAATGERAEPIYEAFCRAIEGLGVICERGVFGAHMTVELANDGPVTLVIDSADMERPRGA